MTIAKTILAAVAVTAFAAPVMGQDADFKLPEQCTKAAAAGGMDHSALGQGGMGPGMMDMMGMMRMEGMDLESMPEHVQENMGKMMITMPAMHVGMMNTDADVAFACGMIAHHQGAIDMAQVLLTHGDDPQMRALAEAIIAAQVGEIEQMTVWLAENAN
jgi:uncharacterized protein (DUF305 family)